MKILMISAIAAATFALAGTVGILRSNSHSINVGTAGMPTMQELQSFANVDELPAEDFEDRSLVFSREIKHQSGPCGRSTTTICAAPGRWHVEGDWASWRERRPRRSRYPPRHARA